MAISNKINQSFDEKKSRFSIKYILAEVFLITAGILIALAIDNWNTDRSDQKKIHTYLIEIKKEFEQEQKYLLEQFIPAQKKRIELNKRALSIIQNKQVDSTDVLQDLLYTMTHFFVYLPTGPMYEEFMDQNLLYKIRNEDLKFYLKQGNEASKDFERWFEFYKVEYENIYKPFMVKNLNYSEIVLEEDGYFKGGAPTNYRKLFDNLEFWNIVNFKGERMRKMLQRCESILPAYKYGIDLLNKELNLDVDQIK